MRSLGGQQGPSQMRKTGSPLAHTMSMELGNSTDFGAAREREARRSTFCGLARGRGKPRSKLPSIKA
ncbi:unnamed protein product [Amoebophrya sp. A25]|nr:unnamed protein product [Amoebophrya sp. A25]|eukprot:GSA25T00001029001.1